MAKKIYAPTQLRDGGGHIIDFHISDGESTTIDISKGYKQDSDLVKRGFFICPLTTGIIKVKLLGQLDTTRTLTIPVVRVDKMIGLWMEEKCVEIVAGTTVTEALIGWSN